VEADPLSHGDDLPPGAVDAKGNIVVDFLDRLHVPPSPRKKSPQGNAKHTPKSRGRLQ
jgi:hypothetical protein